MSVFRRNNKRVILSLVIFLIVILILGIPFFKWGFINDCFLVVQTVQINNFEGFLSFFKKSIDCASLQSDFCNPSFFHALYRPLVFVFTFIQNYFFGAIPYYYLLVTTVIHGLNSVILFNIFLMFFSEIFSFWGALFFAFHPSLAKWFGFLSLQQYVLELTFLLILILLLKKYYIDLKSYIYYLGSCFIFVLAIFLKEQIAVIPFWIFVAVYFYEGIKNNLCSFKIKFLKALTISFGFFAVLFFYLFVRISIFPIKNEPGGVFNFKLTLHSFVARQIERVGDFITYVVDILGLNWISCGHMFIKGFLVIFLILLLFYPFYFQKKIKYLIFLCFSICLFSWSALLIATLARYMLLAVPFFVFIVLFSVSFYYENFVRARPFIKIGLFLLLIFNMVFVFCSRKRVEKEIMLSSANLISNLKRNNFV